MSAFEKMMAQRKKNTQGGSSSAKKSEFDLNNYFTTYLPKGVNSARKTIRIIGVEGESSFVEARAHSAKIDGQWKTLFCPNHEDGKECPFCDIREELMASDSEEKKKLAKDYNAKLVYVLKVIDRDDEAHGPKFWRFKHNWKKEGVYDKLWPLIENYGSARTDGKCGVTDNEVGRDLVITIERNSSDVPVVTNIMGLDSSPLSDDPAKTKAWTEDEKTWRDVYGVKRYDYLEVVVMGGTPVWDKGQEKYVDKNKLEDESSSVEDKIEDPASELRIAPKKSEEVLEEKAPVSVGGDSSDKSDDLPF
jgi:hypothetical protein